MYTSIHNYIHIPEVYVLVGWVLTEESRQNDHLVFTCRDFLQPVHLALTVLLADVVDEDLAWRIGEVTLRSVREIDGIEWDFDSINFLQWCLQRRYVILIF